ncbi:MAG: hypothetical protein GTN99_07180 [Candidatus Dadabacteria bacterium]|nr:hypothetical protein [Candidatus Dadabacteria bacterium]
MKMCRLTIISLVLFFIIPLNIVWSSALLSLKGISAVAVKVDKLPGFMVSDGITEVSIKQSIEKQLREAKLRVVAYEDWKTTLGGSYLNTRVVPSKSYSGDQYVIYIQIELIQSVTLIRANVEQNRIINAGTWSAGKLMNCYTQSVDSCLQESIDQLVKIFINEIKKVN